MTQLNFTVIGLDDVTTDPYKRITCVTTDGVSLYLGSEDLNDQGEVWKYSEADQWVNITQNLELGYNSNTIKAVNSIAYEGNKIYVGTQGKALEPFAGQIFVNSGDHRGWVNLPLVGTANTNVALRSIVFKDGDLYTAGSYYFVWKYSNGVWSEPYDFATFGLSSTQWLDLISDGSNLYGAISTNNTSANVLSYNGTSWTQISPNCFGDRENLATTKLCFFSSMLHAATFNQATGPEIWRYDGSTWTEISNSTFKGTGSVAVTDMKSIQGKLVVSVEDVAGGRILVWDGSTWEENNVVSDVTYAGYLIETANGVNYLVGTSRKQFIVNPTTTEWVSLSDRLAASSYFYPDGSVASIPLGGGNYRFFAANSIWTLVSEGTMDDPLVTPVSPIQYAEALNFGGGSNGYTRGTDIQNKKSDFAFFNPSAVSAAIGRPNIRYAGAALVYQIPETSTLLLWAHCEEGYWSAGASGMEFSGQYWNGCIRQLVSFDNGLTLSDCGRIMDGRFPSYPGNVVSGINFVHLGGYVIRDGYFYFYYNVDTITSGSTPTQTNLSVMRADYNDVISNALEGNTTDWYKYYNGSFSEPGLNGNSTELIDYIWYKGWQTTFYSPTLGKYVSFHTCNRSTIDYNLFYDTLLATSSSFNGQCFAIVSDDGFTWSFPERVSAFTLSALYTFPLPESNYKGELDKDFRLFGVASYWWFDSNNVTRYHSVETQEFLERDRGSSIGRFSRNSNLNYAVDRGQLHPYVATIHHIGEATKLLQASSYYSLNPSAYDQESSWKNVIQSYANSATELSGAFPNSFGDYTNLALGRDFHKFYRAYTTDFNAHRVSPIVTKIDGPVILAHAFGGLLYNTDFTKRGSLGNLITTNLANVTDFECGSGVFSSSGGPSGTYFADSILNLGERQPEYRNSGILSHVEFCQVSATSRRNNFAVIDVDPSFKSSNRRNELLDSNVLIRQTAYDGFGRLIFNVSKYSLDSNLYDKTTNFLSPDHEFSLKLKAAISNSNGSVLGGGTVGIWIHTKPEQNKVWSFTQDGMWVQHSASSLGMTDVLPYCNLFNLETQSRDMSQKFSCIKFLDTTNPNRRNDVIASLSPSDFKELTVSFHTLNRTCDEKLVASVPAEYFDGVSNHIHRLDQEYTIEIFTIPTRDDKFTLYYGLEVTDQTLREWSMPKVITDRECDNFRVSLTKEQILSILKYFNQLRGEYSNSTRVSNFTGYASRSATDTSGIYEASGGSRITLTEDPVWYSSFENGYGFKQNIYFTN